MSTVSVSDLWDALKRYDGVPSWWAEVFCNLGFTAAEAVTWVETASHDPTSPLSTIRERDLNITLQGYAAARGINLIGAGVGDVAGGDKEDKFTFSVSTVVSQKDQEIIEREVGEYADVKFTEKINGVYTQHAVANAVRSVHAAYLRRTTPFGAKVLDAGASLKSAVLAGVDPALHHCCCPVLDVRDSVRHSLRGWLEHVAADSSKYRDRVKYAAGVALDPESGFVCRQRAQDCTCQVDVVHSNESTHDVPFQDLPLIMARHGARLWVGFATRAVGVRRIGGPVKGQCEVFGTRWRVDKEKDEISFHFHRDSSFSYKHKFSDWIQYEEQFGYRWSGAYFDYVYTRMPITTAASLAFVVARVPKAVVMLREPVYKPSGLEGFVKVTTVKAVGACVGGVATRFEPYEFVMEALVFDRALETRLAIGERGGLASTITYMRSARVRLAVNGVALGAVTSVPTDILEPAAVAIEVLAADKRRAGSRDYDAVLSAVVTEASASGMYGYFSGLANKVVAGSRAVSESLRVALLSLLNGPVPLVVKVERCEPCVRVSDGAGLGVVADVPRLEAKGCGCQELMSVVAALKMGSVLSASERKELSQYADRLRATADACVVHNASLVPHSMAEDVFFDASETISGTTRETSVFSGEGSTETLCSSVVSSEACEHLVDDCGSVSDAVEECEGEVVSAIREYSSWAQLSDVCARNEAALMSDVLFQLGPPTLADVERSTTARTRHAVVSVINGKITKIVGTLRDEDEYAEIYVRSLKRTTKVFTEGSGRKYIREPISELCYTSSCLAYMNGDGLCRSSLAVLQDLPRGFQFQKKYQFVSGVPGCGKTYEIKEAMRDLHGRGKKVMYLTATTSSCSEVLESVSKYAGGAIVCRTYDSFVLNGVKRAEQARQVDVLFLDEVSMTHKGQLFVAMLMVKASEVRFYGDPEQIYWLPFMADFQPKFAVLNADEVYVDKRSVSHRLGPAACASWLDVYGEIFPCDCHDHDEGLPEVVEISSASAVSLLTTGKTLTFTQEEKMTVKREVGFLDSVLALKGRDNGGLSTVAEDQGGTHDDVSIVRVVNKKNPKESRLSPSIYNKQPWVLVAMTRHRRRLKYYTTAGDDLVRARIELASCSVRLDAVRRRISWERVKDRATHVRVFGV